jgi:hypothetical protein
MQMHREQAKSRAGDSRAYDIVCITSTLIHSPLTRPYTCTLGMRLGDMQEFCEYRNIDMRDMHIDIRQ